MTVVKMFQNTPEGRMRAAAADRAEAAYEDRDLMEQGAVVLACLLECHAIAKVHNVERTLALMDAKRRACNTPGPRDAFTRACDCLHDILAHEASGDPMADAITYDLPAVRDEYFTGDE